jgi:hypothetical protein
MEQDHGHYQMTARPAIVQGVAGPGLDDNVDIRDLLKKVSSNRLT